MTLRILLANRAVGRYERSRKDAEHYEQLPTKTSRK